MEENTSPLGGSPLGTEPPAKTNIEENRTMTTALHRSPRPQPTRSVLSAYRDNLRWQLDQSASRYAAGDTVQAALVVIGDWLYADTDRTLAEYLSARIPPARLEAVPPDRHRAVVEAIVLLTQAAHDEQQRETARG